MTETIKPLYWVGTSKKDLLTLPENVVDVFGFALHLAQTGKKHFQAKPLRGFGGAGVIEIAEEHKGDTYRAIYTVKFAKRVYVLHCFQKKSKRGTQTPKPDIQLIRERLRIAKQHAAGM